MLGAVAGCLAAMLLLSCSREAAGKPDDSYACALGGPAMGVLLRFTQRRKC